MTPSLPEMVQSLWLATSTFAKAGFPLVDYATFERRVAMCRGCDQWDAQGFGGSGRCRLCGCSTKVKLRMATAACPAGKWDAVN